MTEFELKFQVPPGRVARLEAELSQGPVVRTRMRARYFDTPGRVLARAGLALRLRQENEAWVQTAKGPGPGGFERLEHEVALPPGTPVERPELARHAGHPLHALLARALQGGEGELAMVFETEVDRTARTLAIGDARVELALDRGLLRAGERLADILELEFERKQGSAGAAVACARAWCARHGLWLDPLSKAGRGWRLANDTPVAPAVTAEVLDEVLDEAGRLMLARVLDASLAQVLANARELAAGLGGEEHVHQLRVGLRRLRTALRELRACGAWDTLDARVEASLAELFHTLGDWRDRSTVVPALLRDMAPAQAPTLHWEAALPDAGAALREATVQDTFLVLVGLARELQEGEGVAPKALRRLAGKRLRRLHRQVLEDGPHFERLPQAARHRLRKRLKRLRYLAELVRPLYPGRQVDRFVRSLKGAQDALGSYQDLSTARALLEEVAGGQATAWFGAGWAAARGQASVEDCAKAMRRLKKRRGEAFWG